MEKAAISSRPIKLRRIALGPAGMPNSPRVERLGKSIGHSATDTSFNSTAFGEKYDGCLPA